MRAMVKDVAARRPIDRGRIYLTVFSSGAGMTVHSGFEYGAAGSQNMDRQACTDMGSYADAVPTIVTHGQEDDIVQPINGCQAAERTTQTLDLVGDGVDDDVDTLTEIIEEYQRLEIDANPVDRVAPWNIRRTYWEKRTDLVR